MGEAGAEKMLSGFGYGFYSTDASALACLFLSQSNFDYKTINKNAMTKIHKLNQ